MNYKMNEICGAVYVEMEDSVLYNWKSSETL